MATFGWFTSHGVSCDWDCHRARGSLGGEDRTHPAGSPILAPYDCTITYGMYNDGASYVQFKYANGYAHRAIHIQSSGRVREGKAREGVRCALSDGRKGTYGAGTSTGPHIHFHGIDTHGNRIPWEDVPPPYTLTGGTSVTTEEEDMNTDQDAKLTMLAEFVNGLRPLLMNGQPGVDLSTPRIDQAIFAAIDLHRRFIYRDGNGVPTYDLAQLVANSIHPMIVTLLAAVGKQGTDAAQPVDVHALAEAIRDGLGEDVADELAKRITRSKDDA